MSDDMNMAQVLKEAATLVVDDRAKQHGDVIVNHRHIAELWNGYLWDHVGQKLKPSDIANMMELLKIARRKAGEFNADDYVDAAGYAAVAHECSR